jgi:endoglucanase
MKQILTYLIIVTVFLAGCESPQTTEKSSDFIRLNQIGYYPGSVKQFVVVDTTVSSFEILDQHGNKVFTGELTSTGAWPASGEQVVLGDFSAFDKLGTFSMLIDGNLESHPFEIKEGLYSIPLQAAIKSYYYQRASMPIEEKYAGVYARAAGHPDDNCQYHPSSGHEDGTLDSPGGWYDAGDYGKYIVNASLSVGQMLQLAEMFPEVVKDGDLNIPESGNGTSDFLDELKYELDWILTMQDKDGGVFHKLTAKSFSGFIMPADYDLDRFIIGKGTAATLNFAAVTAQASRIYKTIDGEWSGKALEASEKAWRWAVKNDSVPFANPKDVVTGEYGDNTFSDDFYWAAVELYLTTGKEEYEEYMYGFQQPYIHQLTNSWKFFIRNNGFHSLLENRNSIDLEYAVALVNKHMELADGILAEIEENPYRIALERYEWGSNSDILNQAMILCYAHRISGEEKYLNGAEQINDYIYGKNATGYCFLTGYGSKKVMNIHHRPSGADGIEDPVPGFIVGGPNDHRQDKSSVDYTSEFPAKAFMDVQDSYTSNEVCINWNAPAVFVMGYLEEVRK